MNNIFKAENKFIFFKDFILPQIQHRINIIYEVPDWGLPKGKKNKLESNLECAQREFEEETGLNNSNYEILDRLYPLVELFKGSDGLDYKHIYYIALLKDIPTQYNITKNSEIGETGLYKMNDSLQMIRNYSIDRKNIINTLKCFFIYNMRYFEKFYHNKSY